MSLAIEPEVIDVLLLGQGDRRRQLQDFPILADVWIEYGLRPNILHDVLITPQAEVPAARVASFLDPGEGDDGRMISYLQGVVAARLPLSELSAALIPVTVWWDRLVKARTRQILDGAAAGTGPGLLSADTPGEESIDDPFPEDLVGLLTRELEEEIARAQRRSREARPADEREDYRGDQYPHSVRQLIRLGVLLGFLDAAEQADAKAGSEHVRGLANLPPELAPAKVARLGAKALQHIQKRYLKLRTKHAKDNAPPQIKLIWLVTANREAEFATLRSVPAIKADAARQLFNISCKDIAWAVIDSGIDGSHPALNPRVKATYDFSKIRRILNKANCFNKAARVALAAEVAGETGLDAKKVEEKLEMLATDLKAERAVAWSLVEPLVQRKDPPPPLHPHGTHVAGILGGNWVETRDGQPVTRQLGVCPDIQLYDFRVLGPGQEQSEFAVIAALQFIRYLNGRNAYSLIDGVNMSLSIPHNVRNYACGQTPVCLEAEALTANGVVVVAAAGNRGYQRYRLTDDSTFESYAASSVTDPGNADSVITVGATHRYSPHTYGVSFFSSRGPTGDGRQKPDILAPGERIESCVPGESLDTMDGTSMAAPHVSGAAALLMARHREFRGRPAQVKRILCETATDLGRERSFQGHGMVDVLRAIQSI